MSVKIFEISWEVGNKVGGIHTVLSSKSKYAQMAFGENYYVIGPYLKNKSEKEFKIYPWPDELKEISQYFANKVFYGKWIVEGMPQGFLVDFQSNLKRVNEIKYFMWEKFRIDSLRSSDDFNEPVAWAYSVYEFLKELFRIEKYKKSLVHVHEWLAGPVLLFLKQENPNIVSIFTTHATVLGRVLSGAGIDFYNFITDINADEEAYKYFVEAKHQTEKATANFADFMTTVSTLTAEEVKYFLKREVDYILPNGFDLSKFPTFEEIASKHKQNKRSISEFLLFFFSPYVRQCNLKDAFFIFTSGRKEIRNKGIDIAIKSVARVNQIMKENNIFKPIYFFIFVPSQVIDINHEVLENFTVYRSLEEYISNLGDELVARIIHHIIHGEEIKLENIFENEEKLQIENIVQSVKRQSPTPLSTHILPVNDEIISLLKEVNLTNKESDPVKVIVYPIYVSAHDGFLNLNYYEAINGMHLGIFPSAYEPWGYTPLESLAAGVMTITSDTSGFGCYVLNKNLLSKENPGLWILKRRNKEEKAIVEDLARLLSDILMMPRKDRIQNKYEARKLASVFDWKELYQNYLYLYDLAAKKYEDLLL